MLQVNCRERKIDEEQGDPIGKNDDVACTYREATATPTTAVSLLRAKTTILIRTLSASCGVTADAQARSFMLRSIVGMRSISLLLVVYHIYSFTRML